MYLDLAQIIRYAPQAQKLCLQIDNYHDPAWPTVTEGVDSIDHLWRRAGP